MLHPARTVLESLFQRPAQTSPTARSLEGRPEGSFVFGWPGRISADGGIIANAGALNVLCC